MSSAMRYRLRTFQRYMNLINELVKRDIKLRYRRSFLGYVWSIVNPLLIMIVLTVVFSAMFKKSIENYPIYLLTGRMLFEFVSSTTRAGLHSVTGNSALLKKTYLPKYVFTLSRVTSSLIDTLFSIGALVIVMVATRSPFYWQLVLVPNIFIQIYLFTLGLSFFLGQANVYFRDIEYIYGAVLVAWRYLTPIFYPIDRLPELLQVMVKIFNPMYYYVAQFRDCVLYGQIPGMRIFTGGWIWALAMLAFGMWTFHRHQDDFILYL